MNMNIRNIRRHHFASLMLFSKHFQTARPFRMSAMALCLSVGLLPTRLTAQELPIAAAAIERSDAVDFATEIMPLLKKNCLACHHEKEAEGGLVLETISSIQKGGDSGPGVVARDVAASLIFARATGAEEPLMPPEDNTVGAMQLTAEELGVLKLWIEQGAIGTDETTAAPLQFQPIPESIRTVYALDVSPDGLAIAVSRGNRVVLIDTADHSQTDRLVDPSLGLGDVADVDLIQSVAFAPNGLRIATGGFRTVRIWKKHPAPVDPTSMPLASASGLVALKADGTVAAVVNAIGDIELWNLTDNTKQHSLVGHADRITGLCLAPATNRLYSCDQSGRLILWDLTSGQKSTQIETQSGLGKLVTSTDGVHVAAIDEQRKIQLWRLDAENKLEPIAGPVEGVTDATAISIADQPTPVLIVASETTGVTIRSLTDNQILRTIDHGAVVDAIALSADQTKLLTGGRDGTSRLWNLADGVALIAMQGDVHTSLRAAEVDRNFARQKAAIDQLNQVTTSLEERLKKENEALAKVSEEQTKAIETLAAQEQARADAVAVVTATEAKITQAEADAQAAQAAIEAAQQAMADAIAAKQAATEELEEKNKAVVAAEAAKQGTQTAIENRKQSLASAEAAQKLATDAIPAHALVVARETSRLKRLEQRQLAQQSLLSGPSNGVVDACLSSDGSRVATAHQSGDVRLYRAVDGLPLARFTASPTLVRPAVAFLGDLVVGFGEHQKAAIWSEQVHWTLERTIGSIDDPGTLSDRVTALDFRSDGLSIAVGSGQPSRSGEVKIFAVQTGQLIRDFGPIHSDSVLGLAFSPDGRHLASSSADKTIRLLDITEGKVLRSMEGHTHHVLGIAWQDDARTIASASADQSVKLWDAETGQQRRTIAGFAKELTAVTFVATTNQVVTTCASGKVQINNGADGAVLKSFDAAGDFLYSVGVTPDGKRVIAGGHSGTVKIWEIADGKLVAELN